MSLIPRFLAGLITFLLPASAFAVKVSINTGVHTTVPGVLGNVVDVLLGWSGLVATGLFLLGCLLMVASGGNEGTLAAGKKIMKASLIGLAIILGSWMILSTFVFLISG